MLLGDVGEVTLRTTFAHVLSELVLKFPGRAAFTAVYLFHLVLILASNAVFTHILR
jgi:hypothetical protein